MKMSGLQEHVVSQFYICAFIALGFLQANMMLCNELQKQNTELNNSGPLFLLRFKNGPIYMFHC